MADELPRAHWKDRVLLCLGRRMAFLVEGDSMAPTLRSGDIVLIDQNASVGINDLVLANHPYQSNTKIIKRISEIDADGALILTGDNPSESTDSRTFGAISIKSIVGKVVCKVGIE